jgi:hypothetical protein
VPTSIGGIIDSSMSLMSIVITCSLNSRDEVYELASSLLINCHLSSVNCHLLPINCHLF